MSIFNPPTGLLGLLCRDLRGDMMTTCAKYVTDVIGILDGLFTD